MAEVGSVDSEGVKVVVTVTQASHDEYALALVASQLRERDHFLGYHRVIGEQAHTPGAELDAGGVVEFLAATRRKRLAFRKVQAFVTAQEGQWRLPTAATRGRGDALTVRERVGARSRGFCMCTLSRGRCHPRSRVLVAPAGVPGG